jgi:hypothetical protein
MKNRDSASGAFWPLYTPLSTSALLLGILLSSCSPPPPLERQQLPDLCGAFFPVAAIGPGTAFGDIAIRNNSEVHNGSVDVKRERDGSVKADIYGPLGTNAASLIADSVHGTIAFENRSFSFAFNQTMDTLPLEWGRDLTCKEFLSIILGKVPEVTATTFCKKQPDSLTKKRNTIYVLWKTDSLEMRVKIDSRSGRLKEACFYFKKHAPFWQLKMGPFHQGIAYKIQFRENDGNYFLIHYTEVNFHE